MLLTNEIARKNKGKYIDCFNRQNNHCGAYPRKIIEFPDGRMGIKTIISGVCYPISDEGFNAVHFDYMFSDLIEVE